MPSPSIPLSALLPSYLNWFYIESMVYILPSRSTRYRTDELPSVHLFNNVTIAMQKLARTPKELDTALDLLADRYRRRLLLALFEHHPQNDDDTQIPAEIPIEDNELDQLRIQMIHSHLPKLEDAGVIVWDRAHNTVSKGSQFDGLLPLLQLLSDHADALPDEWL